MPQYSLIKCAELNIWNRTTSTSKSTGKSHKTYRSRFNVNFNILLKQLYCASVGKYKTLIHAFLTHLYLHCHLFAILVSCKINKPATNKINTKVRMWWLMGQQRGRNSTACKCAENLSHGSERLETVIKRNMTKLCLQITVQSTPWALGIYAVGYRKSL